MSFQPSGSFQFWLHFDHHRHQIWLHFDLHCHHHQLLDFWSFLGRRPSLTEKLAFNVLKSILGWDLKLSWLIPPPLVCLEASGSTRGLPTSGLAVGVLLLLPHETSLLHDVDQAGGEGLRPLLRVHVQAIISSKSDMF